MSPSWPPIDAGGRPPAIQPPPRPRPRPRHKEHTMTTVPAPSRVLSLRTVMQVITALCAAAPIALGLIPDVSDGVTVWTLGICGVLVAVIGAGWAAYERIRQAPAPNTTAATRVLRTTVYVVAAVLSAAAIAVATLPIGFDTAAQVAGILGAVVVVLSAVWNTVEAAAGGTLTIDPKALTAAGGTKRFERS